MRDAGRMEDAGADGAPFPPSWTGRAAVESPPPSMGSRTCPWGWGGGCGLSGDDGEAAEPRLGAQYPPTMLRAQALLQCGRMGRAWALHNTLHGAPNERWTRLTHVFEAPERLPTSTNEIGQGSVIPPQQQQFKEDFIQN